MAKNEWVLVLSSHTIPGHKGFMKAIREFAVSVPEDIVVGFGFRVFKQTLPESTDFFKGFEKMPTTNFEWGAGNTLAVYRKSAWDEHHFRPDIKTAEDLEWFVWAIRRGYTGAKIYGAIGTYRNQGSCIHMFRKGWMETRQTHELLPDRRKSAGQALADLAVGAAYFFKLWIFGEFSLASMARQQSHHLGSCLASFNYR